MFGWNNHQVCGWAGSSLQGQQLCWHACSAAPICSGSTSKAAQFQQQQLHAEHNSKTPCFLLLLTGHHPSSAGDNIGTATAIAQESGILPPAGTSMEEWLRTHWWVPCCISGLGGRCISAGGILPGLGEHTWRSGCASTRACAAAPVV